MRRNGERLPVRSGQEWGFSPFGGDDDWATGTPWQAMRRMQEDMDRMFGQFFGGGGAQRTTPATLSGGTGSQSWAPNVDISQTDGEWRIEADLPGVKKDDIQVEVRDHHLVLNAQMQQETGGDTSGDGQQQRQYHRRERRYGYFQRVIPLPEHVDEDAVACTFQNGVLTVRVPKAEPSRPLGRRIPIHDVEQIPSETAAGRNRSKAELRMTEDVDDHEESEETAGSARTK